MKQHRFYVPDITIKNGTVRIADARLVRQLRSVLRLKKGDLFTVFTGDGDDHTVRIAAYGKDSVEVKTESAAPNANEPVSRVALYCSLLKHENFEFAVQKAVEAGVYAIVPLIAARTVKLGLKEERVRKIIIEAAEQAGRARIPELHAPMEFNEAVAHAEGNDINFFLHKEGKERIVPAGKQLGLFVGPEGGWTENEIEKVRVRDGFRMATLGPLTLRAETAAVIGSYLACS